MSKNPQQITPEDVLKMYYDAMNQGRAEEAYTLFAADAIKQEIFIADPDQVVTDPERIKSGIKARVADNIEIEAWDFQVDGHHKVTCMARVSTDYGRQVGFAPIEEEVEVIIDQSGQIKEFTVRVTPESCARIEAAEAEL